MEKGRNITWFKTGVLTSPFAIFSSRVLHPHNGIVVPCLPWLDVVATQTPAPTSGAELVWVFCKKICLSWDAGTTADG